MPNKKKSQTKISEVIVHSHSKKTDKKLRRPQNERNLAGVAQAFANYFDIDVVLFRLLFVLTGVFGGGGIIAYIICWIVIPEES